MKKVSIKTIHIIVFILGSIFVSISIFHTNLWFDETYSVAIVNHSLIDIWKIGANDVHPVLYYWMLRGVCLLTNCSVVAYRIFSLIPIILTALIGFSHIRKDFGEKTGIFFTFFTCFLPICIIYANQIRMYSWAFFILTVFFIYSYRLYKEEMNIKNWILFGLFSLCSIYIHYYGLMAAGITNLFLLVYFIKTKNKRAIRNIIILGTIQLILYIPWIFSLINQWKHVLQGFWITLTKEDILNLIGCQFVGKINIHASVFFSCFIYLYLIFNLLRKRKKIDIKPPVIAIVIYVTVIIAAIIIQKTLNTPILYYRYLFVITSIYIFVISYMLSHEQNKYIILSICIITLLFGIVHNVRQIRENYDKINRKSNGVFSKQYTRK